MTDVNAFRAALLLLAARLDPHALVIGARASRLTLEAALADLDGDGRIALGIVGRGVALMNVEGFRRDFEVRLAAELKRYCNFKSAEFGRDASNEGFWRVLMMNESGQLWSRRVTLPAGVEPRSSRALELVVDDVAANVPPSFMP